MTYFGRSGEAGIVIFVRNTHVVIINTHVIQSYQNTFVLIASYQRLHRHRLQKLYKEK
jgi:hypothetical protein